MNKLEYKHLKTRQSTLFPYQELVEFLNIAQKSSKILDIGADISTLSLLKSPKSFSVSVVYHKNKAAAKLNQFIGFLGKQPDLQLEIKPGELCNALQLLDGEFDLVRVMHTKLNEDEISAILSRVGNEAQVWLYDSTDARKFAAASNEVTVQQEDVVSVVHVTKLETQPSNLLQPQDDRTLAVSGELTDLPQSTDDSSVSMDSAELGDGL